MKASPSFLEYSLRRLEHSSLFMLLSAAPIAAATVATLPGIVADDGSELGQIKGVWSRFTSDMTPERFAQLCSELMHCRYVDSFQHYISSMLREVFVQRPETMRSSETVKMADVLACGDMDEVVRTFADRKVDALGYQGFDDLLEYLKKNLGMTPHLVASDLHAAREAIEVRNIVVHNKACVNHVFLRRTKRQDLTEGQRFPLSDTYVVDVGKAMHRLAASLDECFITHFRLRFPDDDRLLPSRRTNDK